MLLALLFLVAIAFTNIHAEVAVLRNAFEVKSPGENFVFAAESYLCEHFGTPLFLWVSLPWTSSTLSSLDEACIFHSGTIYTKLWSRYFSFNIKVAAIR